VTAEKETELGQLAAGDTPAVIRCEPESSEALRQAICTLYGNVKLRNKIKKNAAQYAKDHMDKNMILHLLLKQLKYMTKHYDNT